MNALVHYVQECDFMFERLHSSVKTKRANTHRAERTMDKEWQWEGFESAGVQGERYLVGH